MTRPRSVWSSEKSWGSRPCGLEIANLEVLGHLCQSPNKKIKLTVALLEYNVPPKAVPELRRTDHLQTRGFSLPHYSSHIATSKKTGQRRRAPNSQPSKPPTVPTILPRRSTKHLSSSATNSHSHIHSKHNPTEAPTKNTPSLRLILMSFLSVTSSHLLPPSSERTPDLRARLQAVPELLEAVRPFRGAGLGDALDVGSLRYLGT